MDHTKTTELLGHIWKRFQAIRSYVLTLIWIQGSSPMYFQLMQAALLLLDDEFAAPAFSRSCRSSPAALRAVAGRT